MSALIKFTHTVTIPTIGEVDALVQAKFHPGRPGCNYMPNGDPGYPDDPPEVEVISVIHNGIDYTSLVEESLVENDSFCEKVSDLYEALLTTEED